jgi:membrane protein
MPDKLQDKTFKYFNNIIHKGIRFAKSISLPGFDKVAFYDVIRFFIRGLMRGAITTRAASIAFQFLLASLPALIFFFTLIPHIPIENFREEVLLLFQNMMPKNAYLTVQHTIEDMFVKRSGLQLFGLFIALLFASNGLNSIIKSFNATYHTIDTRSALERRLVAAVLVFIITALIIVAISLIVFSKLLITNLIKLEILQINITYYLIMFGRWIIILALIFFLVSFLFYSAPARRTKFRLISPGSSLATILIIVTSLGFSYFVNHFGQFNKLFGSIGTLMVIMIWLNINSVSLLIGFELNASIYNARQNQENELSPTLKEVEEQKDK